MTHHRSMKPLLDALNDRQEAGSPVQFWLRDDDAIEPTMPLDNLLTLIDRFSIPVTLAVIPARSGEALATRLRKADNIAVAVHGWSHQNHAPATEKKQELGLHRPIEETVAELTRGYADILQRHASQFVPLMVPPWNRIDAAIVDTLHDIGFRGLSTFGDQASMAIPMINTHIDVIDWKGSRGGRTTAELVDELVNLISSTRTPIGVLTHHLVHDKQVWDFLEQLFAATSSHAGAKWVRINDLLP